MFKSDRIQPGNNIERPAIPESRSRQWTLRIVALLMVFQAAGLAFVSVIYISQVNWIRERALPGISPTAVDTLLFSILSIPLALFAGRAVLGLMRRQKGAWLQAMAIQALLLIFALTTYIMQEANTLTYWAMVSCIIVVMYLNTHEIRSSFYTDTMESDDSIIFFGDPDNESPRAISERNPPENSEARENPASSPTGRGSSTDSIPDNSRSNKNASGRKTSDNPSNTTANGK